MFCGNLRSQALLRVYITVSQGFQRDFPLARRRFLRGGIEPPLKCFFSFFSVHTEKDKPIQLFTKQNQAILPCLIKLTALLYGASHLSRLFEKEAKKIAFGNFAKTFLARVKSQKFKISTHTLAFLPLFEKSGAKTFLARVRS